MVVVSSGGTLRRLIGDGLNRVESIGVEDWIRTNEGDVKSFAAIYRSQPAVRTVVGFRARNLAQLPINVLRQQAENDYVKVTDNELAKLLRRPTNQGTPFKFMYALVSDLSIYDRTLWVKVHDERLGREKLVRIPPAHFYVEGDQWEASGVRVFWAGAELSFKMNEVLYIDGYTPERNYGGVPPMETLRNVINEELSSSTYRGSMWKNGARLEHVLTRPLEAKRMSPDAKDRFWQRWNARYTGTINAARTAILEEGMGVLKLDSYSAREAQYIEGRKFNIEEVARLFYIPPTALGIMEGATYSNMTAAQRQLYRETFGPDIEFLQQELMWQLGPEDVSDKMSVSFDLGSKIEASVEEMAPALQTLTGGPVLTPNEGRGRLKLPKLPDGDELRSVSGTVDPEQEGDKPDPNADGQDSGQPLGTVTPVRRGTPSVYRQLEREA
jgi:HK97 family phage portal protein